MLCRCAIIMIFHKEKESVELLLEYLLPHQGLYSFRAKSLQPLCVRDIITRSSSLRGVSTILSQTFHLLAFASWQPLNVSCLRLFGWKFCKSILLSHVHSPACRSSRWFPPFPLRGYLLPCNGYYGIV